MRIIPEYAPALAIADEIAVLRAALEREPGSAGTRLRLAGLSNEGDDFNTVIALLPGQSGYEAQMLLATACLARQAEGDATMAIASTAAAVEHSTNDGERAEALSLHAKALDRVGQVDQVEPLLKLALDIQPRNVGAFKRLALHYLRARRADEALELADAMFAAGISHSRVLAARCMALAALGQVGEAQKLAGIDQFLFQRPLAPPPGWNSLQSLNADLVAELLADPAMRYGRFGTASERSWRIDHPARPGAPAVRALIEAIAATATEYAASLSGDHRWLSAKPDNAMLRNWCVITGADGHEQWHMHPHGWMSGGYYPSVPEGLDGANSEAGCLALGLPGGMIGKEAATAFGETLVRPEAGLLTLFPSHGYHRTYPHEREGQRICIAFDICPV